MKKKSNQEIETYLVKHYLNQTDGEMGKALGLTKDSVRSRRKKLGLERTEKGAIPLSPQEEVANDRKARFERVERVDTKKKYEIVLGEVETLKKELEASLALRDNIKPFDIELKESNNDSEAVAFAIASDWHIEETVDGKTVNGMNRYTIEVARKRSEQFFQHTLKLVKKEQYAVKINTLVLALIGDFISGNIHEELLENCSLRPIDAIIEAENILISGIQFLLDNSELSLVIPCAVGNHSRITKKVHVSTERGNSLEYFMYKHIENYFAGNSRVEFRIAEGYLSYMDVYGYTVCFHHGHAIKFGGGIGGLTIPTRKAISQWQRLRATDLHVFGHWHQFMDGGNFIVNGSLIGYNAFAVMIKAEFEKPKQAFFLIDKKRKCKTTVAPILFDC